MKSCLEKSNGTMIYTKLQGVREKLVQIFKYNGTKSIEDILNLYYGSDYIKKFCSNKENKNKYTVINQFCHPISFINLTWKDHNKPNEPVNKKTIAKNKIVEDHMIVENSETLECFDMARTSSHFQTKVYLRELIDANSILYK